MSSAILFKQQPLKLNLKFLILYLSIILISLFAINFISTQRVEAVTGGPACSTWRADIYAINNSASISAGYSPYGNPGTGYTGPSREHEATSVSAAASSPVSACAQPRPLPGVFYTDACAAGSSSCPVPARQFGGSTDASLISLYPPSTTSGRNRFGTIVTLTFIGSTWEAGSAGAGQLTSRNFPSNSQIGNLNGLVRVLLHYTDCTDPAAAGYCPSTPYSSNYPSNYPGNYPGNYPSNYPGNYPSNYPSNIPAVPPTCAPISPSVLVGTPIRFDAANGDGVNYSWVALNPAVAIPPNASGTRYNVTFTTTGTQTVRVTSNGLSSDCSVDVNGPALPLRAETFIYRPELFFISPFSTSTPFQSIVNLPPVL